MRRIDADALMKRLKEDPLYPLVERCNIEGFINAEPTVDAVPVVHGRWIKPTGMMPPEHIGHYECSLCGAWAMRPWLRFWKGALLSKYCPNCGAIMDEKDGDHHD